MRDEPPPALVRLLESLHLATGDEVRSVARRARRLAGDIPLFESVWVDALAQAHFLTPFQAAEINAGHAARLAVGPYVLCERLAVSNYGASYAAREAKTLRRVHLLNIEPISGDASHWARQLNQLLDRSSRLADGGIVSIEAAHADPHRVWAACLRVEGQNAADWMVRYGRFPAETVLEIARQMAAALAALDQFDLVHGDISAAGLLIQPSGHVRLLFPGLRGIVRPAEGHGRAELAPEAYDYLAPERIIDGTPPTPPSDIYACGLLWWHLLTGRPPLAGGNSLARIKAAQAARLFDVRRVAPDVPSSLDAAMRACLERDAQRRPATYRALAQMLGPPTRSGRCALARCLTHPVAWRKRMHSKVGTFLHDRQVPVWLAGAAGCLLMLGAVAWPVWRNKLEKTPVVQSGNSSVAPANETQTRHGGPPRASPAHQVRDKTAPAGAVNQLASFSTAQGQAASDLPLDVLLPAGTLVRWDRLSLRPGQTIRGADGHRPRIMVPAEGLTFDVERLRFLNIDFVASRTDEARSKAPQTHALVNLRATDVTFEGCAFQGHADTGRDVAGIGWDASNDGSASAEHSAPARLKLLHCTLHGVSHGVRVLWPGSWHLQIHNTLHLGPGPLVRLCQSLPMDESMRLTLSRCTLRDAKALIELAPDRADEPTGPLAIEAVDCVFAPSHGSPLVRILVERAPDSLLRSIDWRGQGCLLDDKTPFATWDDPTGTSHPIDDDTLRVNGLVRAAVRFQGPVHAGAEASQVTRWSGPLKSDAPPGIRAAR